MSFAQYPYGASRKMRRRINNKVNFLQLIFEKLRFLELDYTLSLRVYFPKETGGGGESV